MLDSFGGGAVGDDYQRTALLELQPSAGGTTSLADAPALATRAGYHLRGQSSRMFDKLQYRLELWDNTDDDLDLPVVMLGTYDNLFLSHADRDRIAPDEARRRWMGSNGGTGPTLFVDGLLAGTWRYDGDRFEVEPYRRLTAAEQRDVEQEKERIAALLAR